MTGRFHLELPKGAKVIKAGLDISTRPFLWAEVNPNAELEATTFYIIRTGSEFPSDVESKNYIDTFFRGEFVWHLYKLPKK